MMPHDPLSHVLAGLKVHSMVMPVAQFTAPWALTLPSLSDPPPMKRPMPPEMMRRLPLLRGSMMAPIVGTMTVLIGESTWIELASGEILFLLKPQKVRVGSDRTTPSVSVFSIAAPPLPGQRPGLRPYGGGGAATQMAFAIFFAETGISERFFDALPDYLTLKEQQMQPAGLARQALDLILTADPSEEPGLLAVRAQIIQLLFTQAVRLYLHSLAGDKRTWLGSLTDPEIGQVLAVMARRMGEPWTVSDLADEVAMSRSSFAARFTERVGMPPLQYLTEIRMNRACEMLADPACSIKQIAQDVGYDSVAAFSNAFKRDRGISPNHWRQSALPISPMSFSSDA
jgi:AraC family transcriptional regulator, alkane utilization regulator